MPRFPRDLDAVTKQLDGLRTLVVDLRFKTLWQANLSWLNMFVRDADTSAGSVTRARRGWC
jgi:hypothetical protein